MLAAEVAGEKTKVEAAAAESEGDDLHLRAADTAKADTAGATSAR